MPDSIKTSELPEATTFDQNADYFVTLDTSAPINQRWSKITPANFFNGNETGDFTIGNQANGGDINLNSKTAIGTPIGMVKLSPDLDEGRVCLIDENIYIRRVTGLSLIDNLLTGDFYFRNLVASKKAFFVCTNGSAVRIDLIVLDADAVTANFLATTNASAIISGSSDAVDVKGKGIIYVDTSGGNVTIGGLANGALNQYVEIIKTELANSLTVEHEEATGTQKIRLANAIDLTLSNFGGITVRYNGSFWYEV